MTIVLNRLLLAVIVLLGAATLALGQWSPPAPPTFQAIDLPTTDSWTIVLARIAAFKETGDYRNQPATLAVERTLRGPSTRRLDVRLGNTAEELKKRQAQGDRLLVFVPWDPEAVSTSIDLSDKDLAVMTADLKVLRQPEEVIRAVEERLRKNPDLRKARSFDLNLPVEKVAGTPLAKVYGADYNKRILVRVPVDERLERYARSALDSGRPERFNEGLRALGLFSSPDDVARVRPFLFDETGWTNQEAWNEGRFYRWRANGVRDAAFQALQAMGQKVDPPISFDPPLPHDRVEAVEIDSGDRSGTKPEDLAQYSRIKEIFARGANLNSEEWRMVTGTKSLRRLILDGSNFGDGDLDPMTGLSNLDYLGLGGTSVTDAAVPAIARLKALRSVDLAGSITPAGVESLRRLRPDLTVREDDLAFLSALHPRRVDLTFQTIQGWFVAGGVALHDALDLRVTAYVFPAGAEGVDGLLRRGMVSHGWKSVLDRDGELAFEKKNLSKAVPPPFASDTARISSFTPSVLHLQPGERCLIVARYFGS